MQTKPESPFGKPDTLNAEWSAFESDWAVNVSDFPSLDDATRFLLRRKEIFLAAQSAGFPREMLAHFEPNKPGFEARARTALTKLNDAMGWAAE